MSKTEISDMFDIRARFLRSVHLERDFTDSQALNGYVLTSHVRSYAERLVSGLRPESGQRAWRITGDYGSGKSSFALLLANLLSNRYDTLPPTLRRAVDFHKLGIDRPKLLPVLVTGSAEPLSVAIIRSLGGHLTSTISRGVLPSIVQKTRQVIRTRSETPIPDDQVVRLIEETASYLVGTRKYSGLLLLIDELGKFLEYGVAHPERQDVYLLQRLAEAAARSGKAPLLIVGILHQGFSVYAEHLSQSAQREWEKVAGRFDEILFSQPLDDTAILVADALQVRIEKLGSSDLADTRKEMEGVIKLGWYGSAASSRKLLEVSPRLYPLHATVLPVLVNLLSRFGQNERSLFSFLLADEPFALKEFSHRPVSLGDSFRIHHLYDYARSAFGHRLGLQSFRSHWNQIESLIESFHGHSEIELQVLKTVGLLNLLDLGNVLPSHAAIELAVAGQNSERLRQVNAAIKKLRAKKIMYCRGVAGGYCLWPHTSVNLERAYESSVRALGSTPEKVAGLIEGYLETRPVVARRHYIETGNLRRFEVKFSSVQELPTRLCVDFERADGRILVALCETEEERRHALRFARSCDLRNKPEILVAVPQPLRILGRLVNELQRWEWVASNVLELGNDPFATEEVSRQVSDAQRALEQRIRSVIGLQRFTGGSELQWFHKAEKLGISSVLELLRHLSATCDKVYGQSPHIANELVNRRDLSSAAAAARSRLVEGIFRSSSKAYLGMDPARKPPEMSIYLSLLKETNVHREFDKGRWGLSLPSGKNDVCRLAPALSRILELVSGAEVSRVKVSSIFADLRKPPFGIRDGISPILLAIFAVIHQQHVAFYDSGKFMQDMAGLDLVRLSKTPEIFEIQYCKLAGLRSELFERLLEVLGQEPSNKGRPDILDVVRPLCVFAGELTPYAKRTRRVSAHSQAVRSALLEGREPAILLFRQLPEACGFPPFLGRRNREGDIDRFVLSLKAALDELRMAFPRLQDQMKAELLDAFGLEGSFEDARKILAERSGLVINRVAQPQLRAFALRLNDLALGDGEWLESLGSLLCSIPPTKWNDADEERFKQELRQFVARFNRIECLGFGEKSTQDSSQAMRICLTRIDGLELDRVIHFSNTKEQEISNVAKEIDRIIEHAGNLGLPAALRAFWSVLERRGRNHESN